MFIQCEEQSWVQGGAHSSQGPTTVSSGYRLYKEGQLLWAFSKPHSLEHKSSALHWLPQCNTQLVLLVFKKINTQENS